MFLLRPRPLLDESISSWRQRAGMANGFWRYPFAPGLTTRGDPDRLTHRTEQSWLAENTGVSLTVISAMSLESKAAAFQTIAHEGSKLRWVLAVGEKGLPPLTGPAFCPICLGKDVEPYFRVYWRYAFLTECPVHRCPLLSSCPTCEKPIWPASLRHLTIHKQWVQAHRCVYCGAHLATSEAVLQQLSGVSALLWNLLENGIDNGLFPAIPSLPTFFDGLWAISQLLIRKAGRGICSRLPTELAFEPSAQWGSVVEQCPGNERDKILAAAYWLLLEWPERFIGLSEDSGLTKSSFQATSSVNPAWLSSVLLGDLTRRKCGITEHQVLLAIGSLQIKGQPPTKSAVKRVLGVSESKAINALLFRRNRASSDELVLLVHKFNTALANSSESRAQRATLLRDFLIFVFSVLVGKSVDIICTWSREEADTAKVSVSKAGSGESEVHQLLCERANTLSDEYANVVRPLLQGSGPCSANWFIGRNGTDFAGHTLRARVAKLMLEDFPDELWHSCDVFTQILEA